MYKRWTVVILTVLIITAGSGYARAEMESPSGEYYSMVNQQNDIIHQTALQVHPGDTYIAGDNSKYMVVEVNGYTARCVYQGKELMPATANYPEFQTSAMAEGAVPIVKQGTKPTIAVYHTHSDESYVPGDGTESIPGNGGIYDIGDVFVEKLQALGFNAEHDKANHNPHDINAYNRSRKTAANLLKETSPDIIVDIHRDAVPPGQYQTELNGQDATKVKLVVGRSNPNMKSNMEFAKTIKAAMDNKHPGLSGGILVGKGSFNQDLSPRAILIEVGAHTNDKEAAAKGVKAFAEVLPTALGVEGEVGSDAEPAKKPVSDQNSGTTIFIILAVVALAAGGFYLLNKGSLIK